MGAHERIEVISPGASEDEAAAIVAAVEQFLADTSPPLADGGPEISPWARTALEEGIAARQISGYVWGHAPHRAPSGGVRRNEHQT